jgi:flagellar hook protein FlgE
MLRSLYSGISGLRSHQTMLDVTGNNIANVNTAGFKGSAVQFQDTLSQTQNAGTGAGTNTGATNPAQVGLGVKVAGISTNFTQGAGQATGRATDLMISGDGFFAVRSGTETTYTRAGAFDFGPDGRLTTTDGGLVQGWSAVDGVLNANGGVGTITLPTKAVSNPEATVRATVGGNLPSDSVEGAVFVRDLEVFNADGSSTSMPMTFTKTDGGWSVAGPAGSGAATSLVYTNGVLQGAAERPVGGVNINFSATTQFAKLNTFAITGQNGHTAGTLTGYSIGADGIVTGSFSNGATESIAQIALATFPNAAGLEKIGGSSYRATPSSGGVDLGTPNSDGYGSLAGGYLEMSNVDLSQEFTNLIVAQRGFQANARIITTSDEVLQELTNLKR